MILDHIYIVDFIALIYIYIFICWILRTQLESSHKDPFSLYKVCIHQMSEVDIVLDAPLSQAALLVQSPNHSLGYRRKPVTDVPSMSSPQLGAPHSCKLHCLAPMHNK